MYRPWGCGDVTMQIWKFSKDVWGGVQSKIWIWERGISHEEGTVIHHQHIQKTVDKYGLCKEWDKDRHLAGLEGPLTCPWNSLWGKRAKCVSAVAKWRGCAQNRVYAQIREVTMSSARIVSGFDWKKKARCLCLWETNLLQQMCNQGCWDKWHLWGEGLGD